MASAEEQALVQAARAGDRGALSQLLGEYLPLVYNVVGRALRGDSDVDDVVQETMLRIMRRLPDLRDPASFRSWALAIAVHQVQDHARASSAARARSLPVEIAADAADPQAEFADAAAARLSAPAQREDLVAATHWLSDGERRLLALWWQEVCGEVTRAQVAEALSLSPQHTAVRVQRMKTKLVLALAVVRAWRARPRCPRLAAAAPAWTGQADARFLKALARHVRGCQTCASVGALPRPIEHYVAGAGLVPVPALLLEHVAGGAAAGTSAAVTSAHALPVGAAGLKHLLGYVSGKSVAAVTSAVVVTGVAATVLVTMSPGGGDRAAPPLPTAPATASAPVSVPASAATAGASASASTGPPAGADAIYLAPNGDDSGDGSLARPYATLSKAVSVVKPGQTIYLRGGTYRPARPVDIDTSGSAQQPIVLTAYSGEHPVIDAGQAPAGRPFVIQRASHWTVSGLEIVNARTLPYVCESCRDDTFQTLAIHDNRGTGLTLRGDGTIADQILDSDFYGNHDDNGASADGIAFIYGSGAGDLVRGCRTYDNADDGVKIGRFASPVTIDSTWSYGNGVNRWNLPAFSGAGDGFSLGGADAVPGVAHVITRSAAWKNNGYGFTESGNTGSLQVLNDTAFRNAKDGFAFYYSPSRLRGDLALGNSRQAVLAGTARDSGNSWNEPGWGYATLRDLDPASAQGPRGPGGALPATSFLTNTRDAGVGAPMTAL